MEQGSTYCEFPSSNKETAKTCLTSLDLLIEKKEVK